MNDFTYSVVRSFNQYTNANLGTSFAVGGSTGTVILNPFQGHIELDRDTASFDFYDERIREIGGGREAGGSKGRYGEFWVQCDVWSPPTPNGEPRQGANRKFKDLVEQAFKNKVRIDLLSWDGTGGTTVQGGMFIRQEGASPMADESMEGWSRWRLNYYLRAVDHEW